MQWPAISPRQQKWLKVSLVKICLKVDLSYAIAGRTSKMFEMKQAADAAAAQKQAVAAEEDGFRGVHLNPNAHHWDEVRRWDHVICMVCSRVTHLQSRWKKTMTISLAA